MKRFRVSRDLSHTAFRIGVECRSGNQAPVNTAVATGFLWSRDDELFLITNAHNLAGWDFVRGEALNHLGALPTRVIMDIELTKDQGGNKHLITRKGVVSALLDEDGQPAWFVHPQHGPNVDVVALPLGKIDIQRLWPNLHSEGFAMSTIAVNKIDGFTDFDVDAGDDAFVLGYPLGLDGGGNFPIWKRASVASEPGFFLDGLPKTLIDTATRKGMSGSPVIAVRRGLIKARGSLPGVMSGDDIIGQAEIFLGVYSGRVDDDPLGAHLGIVWKAEVVDEIVDGKIRGKLPWEA